MNQDKLRKIQELAMHNLEKENTISHSPLEPEVNGKWRRLTERKWEFRYNNIVLGTIFHKPTNDKFSLFLKTPDLYKKVHQIAADTFMFDNFEEAALQLFILLRERAEPWCYAVIGMLNQDN